MDGYLDTQLNGSCHPLFTVIDAGNGLLDSVETHTNCDGAQPAIPVTYVNFRLNATGVRFHGLTLHE
ncbi:MAG: hypothetical protein WAM42_20680 [Candidatus Nitrosopolaris sp.]|jgi:hypothetical protein